MATITSPMGAEHHSVVVDTLHLLQGARESESATFRVPRALSTVIASDQCCTCSVYPRTSDGTVELSAFVPSSNPQSVHLHCEGAPVQQFNFPDDTILFIKLMPLPSNESSQAATADYTRVVGVLLLVASFKKGLSIYSTVLDKPRSSAAFLPVECREFRDHENHWNGRRIRKVETLVVDQGVPRPFLVVAISSEESAGASQRVDIQQYMLRDHQCPFFQYSGVEPSPANHYATVIDDVGRVKDLTFGEVSTSDSTVTLAVMTATQLTLTKLSLSSFTVVCQSAKLLITGCHSNHALGTASMVVSLGQQEPGQETFAVVCQRKSGDFSFNARSLDHCQEIAIAKHSDSVFYPNASTTDRSQDANTLIDDAVGAAMRELRANHLDEGVLAEVEASKVVTPETLLQKNITDITNVKSTDASTSLMSPLVGLTLSRTEKSQSESPAMESLLSIQSQTPQVARSTSSSPDQESYPNHSAHMILVSAEQSSNDDGETTFTITPVAMPFPQEMARLDVIAMRPLSFLVDNKSPKTPSAAGESSFDDLMFSPSPGKLMSPAGRMTATDNENARFSVVCRAADSQQLYLFVVSVNKEKNSLVVESETCVDVDRILAQSLNVPMKAFSKGVMIDNALVINPTECSSRIRLVLSMDDTKPISDSSSTGAAAAKPINLALEEDSTVLILTLLCTMPLGPPLKKIQNTPYSAVSKRESNSLVESALHTVLDRLTAFENNVSQRMDKMEAAIQENTRRVSALEEAISNNNNK